MQVEQKKSVWNHNHALNYKGLTKIAIKRLKAFVSKEQTKKAHTPSEMKDKVNSYLKAKENNDELSLTYQNCSYIHYSNLKEKYGLAEEDATNLQKLFDTIKKENKEFDQMEGFVVSN